MYAQGILYFSLLNLVGLPSLSHTHTVFQAGCCKGCSRLAKVTLPAKLGGWMRSRAPWGSCPGPLGGSQAASPPPQAQFVPLVPGQGGVYFPGRQILSRAPKE